MRQERKEEGPFYHAAPQEVRRPEVLHHDVEPRRLHHERALYAAAQLLHLGRDHARRNHESPHQLQEAAAAQDFPGEGRRAFVVFADEAGVLFDVNFCTWLGSPKCQKIIWRCNALSMTVQFTAHMESMQFEK